MPDEAGPVAGGARPGGRRLPPGTPRVDAWRRAGPETLDDHGLPQGLQLRRDHACAGLSWIFCIAV